MAIGIASLVGVARDRVLRASINRERSRARRRPRRRTISSRPGDQREERPARTAIAELKKAYDEASERARSINRLDRREGRAGERAARARRDPDHEPPADDDRGDGEADRQRSRERSEQALRSRVGSDPRLADRVHRQGRHVQARGRRAGRGRRHAAVEAARRRRCTSTTSRRRPRSASPTSDTGIAYYKFTITGKVAY